MAKTAPSDYPVIPSGSFYPLEYVVEGGTAAKQAHADLVQGVNHVWRSLTPTVIQQLCNTYADRYLSLPAQAYPTIETVRYCWRIPPIYDIYTTDPMLQWAVWAEVKAGVQMAVKVASSVDNITMGVTYNGADWKLYTDNISFDNTISDTITMSLKRTAYISSQGGGVKAITCWQDRGGDPVPGGLDVGPYAADAPLASYMPNLLATRLHTACGNRPGVVVSWSEDYVDTIYAASTNRATFANANSSGATVEETVLRNLPAIIGPRTSYVRVYANGYGPAGAQLRVWSDYTGKAGATTLTLPTSVAFNFTTSWANDTVQVRPSVGDNNVGRKFGTKLHAELDCPDRGFTCLSGLCIWEEPVS